jgi:HEAT repeat protein
MNTRLVKMSLLILIVFTGVYLLLYFAETRHNSPIKSLKVPLEGNSVTTGSTDNPFSEPTPTQQPLRSAQSEKPGDLKQKAFLKHDSAANSLSNHSSSGLDEKYDELSTSELVSLLASDLTDIERNYLEHLLAESSDEEVDSVLGEMVDDGFMDLSLDGDEFNENEGEEFLIAATNRMNSAIRVSGLRGKTSAIGNIIDIASHHNAEESTVRACYEALGYLGTKASLDYLSSELKSQKNPFLKSEIILSLSTGGNTSNIDLYLSYLKNRDPDLRNSAIVALGEAGEERAVEPFGKIFSTTDSSSRVLIVQALNKINSASAHNLLDQISKSHPQLISTPSEEGEGQNPDE